jgi:hypothetical protein
MAVATGDFDGAGRRDIALLLTDERLQVVRLVAALDHATWTIFELPTWCKSIATCYVLAHPPGHFQRSEALSHPVSSPEREEITSENDMVVSGTLEATGVYYVYDALGWNYVWVSD